MNIWGCTLYVLACARVCVCVCVCVCVHHWIYTDPKLALPKLAYPCNMFLFLLFPTWSSISLNFWSCWFACSTHGVQNPHKLIMKFPQSSRCRRLTCPVISCCWGQVTVGRLRPNFISVCQPNYTQVQCTTKDNIPHYVAEYNCTSKDKSMIRDARWVSVIRMCWSLIKWLSVWLLYSRKFSSAKNFVKSDRQAVRQEFIFVKSRSSLVCSFAYRLSSHSWIFLIPHLWFVKNISQEFNLVKKLLWRKRRN